MSRTTKKVNPGRILFVGAGPGDPDLLTVRARSVLCSATTAFIDPDVPPGVVELIGSVHRPEAAPTTRRTKPVDPEAVDTADDVDAESSSEDPVSVHPALGAPADVAKTLVGIAKTGTDVVRVVAGDPLTSSAVLAEVGAVARTSVAFEVLPGLPAAAVVPSYAGMPLGSGYTVADVRGDVDWAALAAAPGPLVLHSTAGHLAQAAASLIDNGLPATTPVAITVNGTTCAQRTIEATLETAADSGGELLGPLLVTIGKVVTQRGKLSWWETRALYGWTVLVPRTKEQAGNFVYRFDPKSKDVRVVQRDFDMPNGLCFAPEGKTLWIADSGKKQRIGAFPVRDDGTLGEPIRWLEGGADGVRCEPVLQAMAQVLRPNSFL